MCIQPTYKHNLYDIAYTVICKETSDKNHFLVKRKKKRRS